MTYPLCDQLQTIGQRIKAAEIKYQRQAGSVHLLAVSKRHPMAAIQDARQCGQLAFGENYAQEMHEKALLTQDDDIEWHYIGPVQSNKTQLIAQHAHWVHSVDRLKIARRLSMQKPADKPAINICLQLNISHERNKSGISLDELPELAKQVAQLPNIKLRGLMAIPAPSRDFDTQRKTFAKVRKALEALNQQGYNLDTLSMGMSADMEAAIAEGATIVRIGTAIFGRREGG